MAVRQYVGARYVPKFADPVAWKSGTSYEALTIVTYNNSSYTSKIPVPATVGNPADNSEYWALTGNYNAQVEAYREETVGVHEALNEEITNRENADTALGTRITNLEDRYVTLVGDSYMALTPNIGNGVASALGLKANIQATSSMGFVHAVNGETFINELQWGGSFREPRSKSDYIITYGGINDNGQTYDTEYAAVVSYITKLKEINQNIGAKLIIIGPQGSATNYSDQNSFIIHKAMQDACNDNGIPYHDARTWLTSGGHKYEVTYRADLLHPSELGCNIIAGNIAGLINGGFSQDNWYPLFSDTGKFANVAISTYTYPDSTVVLIVTGNGTLTANVYNNILSIEDHNNALQVVNRDLSAGICYGIESAGYISKFIGIAYSTTEHITVVPTETYTGNFGIKLIIPPMVTRH